MARRLRDFKGFRQKIGGLACGERKPNSFCRSYARAKVLWAASEGLDDLVIRIGRMIAYQEYNSKNPLNGLAAKWAAQNTNLLPIDARSISPPLGDAAPVAGTDAAPEISASDGNPKETLGNPWAEKISIA
jgi:hypothetical protein